jgi:hypothetical protein
MIERYRLGANPAAVRVTPERTRNVLQNPHLSPRTDRLLKRLLAWPLRGNRSLV